jgi:ribonucleoside-diphosphate reductase alpha chain
MSNKFEQLSQERKRLQADGKLPNWFTTMGWQAFKGKYLYHANTYEEQIDRIVDNLAQYCKTTPEYFKARWKEMLMKNHAYLATPVLANNGTSRGLSVSCSGGVVDDSIYGFGQARLENAILSQEGFGTSSYLGDIRHRGAEISRGGTADGVLPVFKDMVIGADNVSQGGVRRGAWAGYLGLSHPDFWEIALEVRNNPDGSNIGWNLHDEDLALLDAGDEELTLRFQETQYLKCLTGKGYYYFPDKVARMQPDMYNKLGLSSKASNLCTEITLHADKDHSYTCVLSGMVLTTFDEWKDTDAVFCMTVMLDCLVEDFLVKARNIKGIENIVRGTEKGRAIGLGMTGYHSALQQRGLPWSSMEAHFFNMQVSKHLHDESLKASQMMAKEWGEPEWCKGYGVRNTHRTALAPNVSSALIFGSESQGTTPWYGNVYSEGSASGSMYRINPVFATILEAYGQNTSEVHMSVLNNGGSVKDLDFLSDHEKEVLLTAFEINQINIINSVSRRQPFICQGQSCNLFFAADEEESYISYVHQYAFEDPNMKSLYYLRSKAGVDASKGGCETCAS